MANAFAPILRPFVFAESDPVEVIPGFTVERASDEQIDRIRRLILGYSPPVGAYHEMPSWECRLVETKTSRGKRGRFSRLPRTQWRYNVVEITRSSGLGDLEAASIVSDFQLDTPIVLFHGGSQGNIARTSHCIANCPLHADWPVVTREMLADIAAAYGQMLAVRDDYPEVRRALETLNEMRLLPKNSEFEILGLFAIIEMLLSSR